MIGAEGETLAVKFQGWASDEIVDPTPPGRFEFVCDICQCIAHVFGSQKFGRWFGNRACRDCVSDSF